MPQLVAIAAAVSVLVVFLLRHASRQSCEGPDCRSTAAFWSSAGVALVLGAALGLEDEAERVSPRPVWRRRAVLVLAVTVLGIALAGWSLLSDPTMFGAAATTRNVIAVVGVSVLGLSVLPRSSAWALPVVMVLGSALYLQPWEPDPWQTVWGMLRQPGGVSTPAGARDYSWAAAVLVYGVGVWCYARAPITVTWTRRETRVGGRRPSLRAALREQHVLPVSCLLLMGVIIGFRVTSRDLWGGHPGLLLTTVLDTDLLVLIPLAAAWGCWVGQARTRSGMGLVDRAMPRPVWHAMVVQALVAFVTFLMAIAGALALLMLLTIATNGRPLAVSLAAVGPHWGGALLVLLGLSLLAALGTVIGFRWGWSWLTPLVAFAVYMAQFFVFQLLPEDDNSLVARGGASFTVCRGDHPRICAEPINAAYLPAAQRTVERIYRNSGLSESLASVVLVADDARAVGAVEQTDVAIVTLQMSRGFRPPEQLRNDMLARGELSAINPVCTWDMGERLAFGIPEEPPQGEDLRWYRDFAQALKQCDKATIRALASQPR